MASRAPTDAVPSAKQLVFLSMTAAVVAVIVFLCGVLVGRGVPVRRPLGATAAAELGNGGAVDLGVAGNPTEIDGSPLDDLSYFSRLHSVEPAPETLEATTETQRDGEDGLGVTFLEALVLSGDGDFAVQVTALRGADEAADVAAGLVEKGYPAFVVDPTPGTPVAVHRVRVGPYTDRTDADHIRDRLEIEEQFKPWVVHP